VSAWLVVPCPQARVAELGRCLSSLAHDPDRTVIVTAQHHDPIPTAPVTFAIDGDVIDHPPAARLLRDRGQGFSIARLWNLGLTHAYDHGATSVAVFASDVTGRPDSIPLLADLMATTGCVLAAPALEGETRILTGPRTTHDRIPGGCWMVDARHRLLCDESYRWWYADDDLEMRARKLGPVGLFAGTGLALGPDAGLDTAEKRGWAEEDRARFVTEHGCEPW